MFREALYLKMKGLQHVMKGLQTIYGIPSVRDPEEKLHMAKA